MAKLLSIHFKIPPLQTQRKIAAILSAYDDLIENNNKRIALLERAAENIYREWFVRLRFPGHEGARFVKGIPEGWGKKSIHSLCDEIRNSVKVREIDSSTRYLGLEHIPRKSISITDYDTVASIQSNKLLFREYDILFGKIRPYLHKISIAHFSGACSSDTIIIRPRDKMLEGFLLFTIFSDTFVELATISSKGTKMPRADWDFLKKLEIIIPNNELLRLFQTYFESQLTLIRTCLQQNELLKQSRDLLLSRLISGKLAVDDLDIRFPAGMEEDTIAD